MNRIFIIGLFIAINFSWAADGGSTRGNGGGGRHLEEFLAPVRQSYGQLSAVNLSDRVNAFFESSQNLDCDILQNYFSLAIGLVEFYRDSGFEFKDKDGKVINLKGFDVAGLRQKYSEPGACVDKSITPNASALLEITDKLPPSDYEQDLMALNYQDTGKLVAYRQNWRPSAVLKRESCRSLGDDVNTSMILQKSCLFTTHLSVAMHEILSLAGFSQEKTKRYDISSNFAVLATLNRKNPDPRAVKLIEHLAQHYLNSFAKVKDFDEKAYKLFQMLTTAPFLKDEELKIAYEAWKPAFFDIHLIATRFRVLYFNLNIFLEFIVPNSYVPYTEHFAEYRDRYLKKPMPRLGLMGLIKDSRLEELMGKKYQYSAIADLQRILFEISFFTDLMYGEQYENAADIYGFNLTLPHEIIGTKKTADEIEGWSCKQFPGLNGKKNFMDGR